MSEQQQGKKMNSRAIKIILMVWIGSVILASCGPRMSTVTDYVPPASASGLDCIAKANQDRSGCETDYDKAFIQCKDRIAYETEDAYKLAQNEYTHQLEMYIHADEKYEHDFTHYEEQKRLLIHDGELKYIRCSNDVKMQEINKFPECKKFITKAKKRSKKLRPPSTPVKPYAPDRDHIYSQLMGKCRNMNNDCEFHFNQAYRACGGTVTNRQVCVSNCD